MKIKSNIAEIMKKQNLTIRVLSKKTGLSTATIQKARDSRIESCSLGSLKKIAYSLNVDIIDLFASIPSKTF